LWLFSGRGGRAAREPAEKAAAPGVRDCQVWAWKVSRYVWGDADHAGGEGVDVEAGVVEVSYGVAEHVAQGVVGRGVRQGAFDVLGLAAAALRGDDHAAGDGVRGLRAELAAHQVQAGVDSGSAFSGAAAVPFVSAGVGVLPLGVRAGAAAACS
jgi:hypothetical protein